MTLYNLNSVPTGMFCRIKWLTGKIADTFRDSFLLCEDTDLFVISNNGKGGMIVGYGNRRLAMSRDAADHIRVECA